MVLRTIKPKKNAVSAQETLEREIDQAVQAAITQAESELQQAALQATTEPPAETTTTEET